MTSVATSHMTIELQFHVATLEHGLRIKAKSTLNVATSQQQCYDIKNGLNIGDLNLKSSDIIAPISRHHIKAVKQS